MNHIVIAYFMFEVTKINMNLSIVLIFEEQSGVTRLYIWLLIAHCKIKLRSYTVCHGCRRDFTLRTKFYFPQYDMTPSI